MATKHNVPVSDGQREILLADIEDNDDVKVRYAAVVADLHAGRPVADSKQFAMFLWDEVALSVECGLTEWVRPWYAAVRLLEQIGEDLGEKIFEPGPTQEVRERRARWEAVCVGNPNATSDELLAKFEAVA